MTRQPIAGSAAAVNISTTKIGMPTRVFLWTLDQIAVMLNVEETTLRSMYIFYSGRSTGNPKLDQLQARNIAPKGASPEWRVPENELKRWLKRKGFRFYEASQVTR